MYVDVEFTADPMCTRKCLLKGIQAQGMTINSFILEYDGYLDSDPSQNSKKKFTPNIPQSVTDLFGIVAVENQSQRLDVDSKPHGLQRFSLLVTACCRFSSIS